jgi:Sec-independent protein translocase protein TatA
MVGLGPYEFMFVGIIILLFFGARLPEMISTMKSTLSRSVGASRRNWHRMDEQLKFVSVVILALTVLLVIAGFLTLFQ